MKLPLSFWISTLELLNFYAELDYSRNRQGLNWRDLRQDNLVVRLLVFIESSMYSLLDNIPFFFADFSAFKTWHQIENNTKSLCCLWNSQFYHILWLASLVPVMQTEISYFLWKRGGKVLISTTPKG